MVNIMSKQLNFQLFEAIKGGSLIKVRHLVNKGADVNVVYEDAISDKWLKSNRFDREFLRDKRNTPLLYAITHDQVKCVEFLLKNGASVDVKTKVGQTALGLAVGRQCFPIIQALIEAGADVNGMDRNGNTPFHYASRDGYTKGLQVLFKAGANPLLTNRAPGISAADILLNDRNHNKNKEISALQKLMNLYVDHNNKLNDDRQNIPEIQVLEQSILNYQLLLAIASNEENSESDVRRLMDEGADVFGKMTFNGKKVSPIKLAVKENNLPALSLLMNRGAKPDGDDLLYAVSYCYFECAKEILQYSHINIERRDKELRRTPLMIACATYPANIELIRILLQKGADVNKADKLGCTSLMRAYDSVDVVDLLLRHHADSDVKNEDGKTFSDIVQEVRPTGKVAEYLANREHEQLLVTMTNNNYQQSTMRF